MKFCKNCENYLVLQINDGETLITYHCYNCGYEEKIDISKNDEQRCIYKTQTDLSKIKIYSQNLKYLKFDKTLPHVDNINCPNEKCPTHQNITNTLPPIGQQNSTETVISTQSIEIKPTTILENVKSIPRNNVLYMNLNDNMMIYLYQCCNCDYTWTNK